MSLLTTIRGLLGRPPPPSPAPPGGNVMQGALRTMNARLLRAPNDRVSRDPQDLAGLLSFFEEQLTGYLNDSRRRIIHVLRALAENDDDVSGSLGDLQALCGAGFTLDFTGGACATKQAKDELEAWAQRVFPEGGGLQGLIANLVGEIALAGAASCEWYPERSRQGVAGVAVVPPEEIRIRRDPATQTLVHQQVAPGNAITLNPRTYLYAWPCTSMTRP